MAVSPHCSAAQLCSCSRYLLVRYFEILQHLRLSLVQDPSPVCRHSLSNHPGWQSSTCHHPMAVGRNLFMVIHHAGHNVLCLPSGDHLPLERKRKWISMLGFESRFTFFPCVKLPSSVTLFWSIAGIRSNSFLPMGTWTWKPSFSLPTPSGS